MHTLNEWPEEFWRVNGYGYPHNFFEDNKKAKEAWDTFLSFFNYSSYSDLKDYWSSDSAPREIDSHTLESWKALFEECGLLYVISHSNEISITEPGCKLKKYGEEGDLEKFIWIAVNLLVRYPLRGPRGNRKNIPDSSDLFPYRFLYAALLELDNYIWISEFERVLYHTLNTNEALNAVKDIKKLRGQPSLITTLKHPKKTRGAFYNNRNQALNHAGLNYLIFDKETMFSPYNDYLESANDIRISINPRWLGLIKKAMIADSASGLCRSFGSYVLALPSYTHESEQSYFDSLCNPVTDINAVITTSLKIVKGYDAGYLEEGVHFNEIDSSTIVGKQRDLCQLAVGQRVILNSRKKFTYLVQKKVAVGSDEVRIEIRRARPITNFDVIKKIMK